jgi:predicted Rossmann-fold nucleotide-binding protein
LKVLKKQIIKEIESLETLFEVIKKDKKPKQMAFQDLDLVSCEMELSDVEFSHCIFLGCRMSEKFQIRLMKDHNVIFPPLNVPYNPYRAQLYTIDQLYKNYDRTRPESYLETPDFIIYDYFTRKGRYYPDTIFETLAQKLHDHSITDAMMDLLEDVDANRIVAIMGGHRLGRDNSDYFKVVSIARKLVEKGYILLSGGGPGAMEATHLGAWMAGRTDEELLNAIAILAEAPDYAHPSWLAKAFEVRELYPKKFAGITDIGIPTWLYGHEQATPFAGLVAKYFENSVREEGLLALAFGGVLYTPGSAGTIQEIFQDATQNHYKSYDMASPMIFLNLNYWMNEKPVYPLLYRLAEGREYQKWLGIYDEPEEVLRHFDRFSIAPKS